MIIKHNDSYYEDWQEGVRLLGELYHDIRWREVIKNTYGLQPEYYVNIENDKVRVTDDLGKIWYVHPSNILIIK